jgi:hypothetical protein
MLTATQGQPTGTAGGKALVLSQIAIGGQNLQIVDQQCND